VIEDNRIHDCGRMPATKHDHGIYVADAKRLIIRDNLIYDNADRGVQLYPRAEHTRIVHNVIDDNGEGIIFANRSDHSVVKGNIISNSLIRHNVESSASTARDNVVRGNCLWSDRGGYYGGEPPNSGVLPGHPGFKLGQNTIADPEFQNRLHFRPSPTSRCAGMGPRD
jgi:putative cofactor-binding repeat protein